MRRSHSPQRGLSAVACGASGPLKLFVCCGAATERTPAGRTAPAPAVNGAAVAGAHTEGFTALGTYGTDAGANCTVAKSAVSKPSSHFNKQTNNETLSGHYGAKVRPAEAEQVLAQVPAQVAGCVEPRGRSAARAPLPARWRAGSRPAYGEPSLSAGCSALAVEP